MVITLSAIAYMVGAGSPPSSESRSNLRGNVVSASAPREVEFVFDFSSMNSSMFDETNDTRGSLENSSNDSTDELESEWHQHWGIPHHPIRRAMVCHAVFGHHHRFLRRACWFAGFVEVSPNVATKWFSMSSTAAESRWVALLSKSTLEFGNETSASNVELTSERGA